MKKLFLMLFLVIVIGGGLMSAKFLGTVSAAQATALSIVAHDVQGTVEYRRNDDAWKPVTNGFVLVPNDSIRTSASSSVSIDYYTRATSRLDENTEITILPDTHVSASRETHVVALQADHGRLWNRVLKLLDSSSSYTVQHSDVVATVRGTGFVFVPTETGARVDVVSHTVGVKRGEQEEPVPEGFSLDTSAVGASSTLHEAVTSTPPAFRDEPWFQDNQKRDDTFDKEAEERWEAVQERAQRFGGWMPLGAAFVPHDPVMNPNFELLSGKEMPRPPQPGMLPPPGTPQNEQPQNGAPPPQPGTVPPAGALQPNSNPPGTPPPTTQPPTNNPVGTPPPTGSPTPTTQTAPPPTQTTTVPPPPPGPVVVMDITVQSPPSTIPGGTAQFHATARYSDNTQKDITASASWQVLTAGGGTIAGGLLSVPQAGPNAVDVRASFGGKSADGSVAVFGGVVL